MASRSADSRASAVLPTVQAAASIHLPAYSPCQSRARGWPRRRNASNIQSRPTRSSVGACPLPISRHGVGDAALAEEATAQTLVKIWSRCGQWRGQSAAGTWIYRIAVRTVLDVQRSQTRWWRRTSRPVPVEMYDRRPRPDEEASGREQSQQRERRVQAALRQLPETDRVLVHLYYFEERTLGEIESILDVPKANLKMRLARARQKLRSLLGGTDDD